MADLLTRPRQILIGGDQAIPVGGLAGTNIRHNHVPDQWTGSTCLACYGWCDDPRHPIGRPRRRR